MVPDLEDIRSVTCDVAPAAERVDVWLQVTPDQRKYHARSAIDGRKESWKLVSEIALGLATKRTSAASAA